MLARYHKVRVWLQSKKGFYNYRKGENQTFGKPTLKLTYAKHRIDHYSFKIAKKNKNIKNPRWNILTPCKCSRAYKNAVAAIFNTVMETSKSRDEKNSNTIHCVSVTQKFNLFWSLTTLHRKTRLMCMLSLWIKNATYLYFPKSTVQYYQLYLLHNIFHLEKKKKKAS